MTSTQRSPDNGCIPVAIHRPDRPLYLIDESTGCWVWQRAGTGTGYGRLERGGVKHLAHRYFYEQIVGPVPPGMQLDHLCRNRACVNPEHLEPVTAAENSRRSRAPKLTLAIAREIRRSSESNTALAQRYGVHRMTINRIRLGQQWNEGVAA